MGLDYTDGCVNFRDVGEYINLITGDKHLPEGMIFRSGSIDYIKDESEIGFPKSIFNLRNREDYSGLKGKYFHFPMSNKIEKYNTNLKEVRRWLNQIMKEFENPELKYPVLIHCLSGKDRTGIVIASLLLILGFDLNSIIEEYLLSEGEVSEELIRMSLEGIGHPKQYFDKIDLDIIKNNLQRKK